MKPKQKRLLGLLVILLGLGLAVGLALFALRETVSYFYTPSELLADPTPAPVQKHRAIRLGGLVEQGSIARESDGLTVRFRVTDGTHSLPVLYHGVLPDLFREGQGVVADGTVEPDGSFIATRLLAKHDENYKPPELVKGLEKAAKLKAQQESPP